MSSGSGTPGSAPPGGARRTRGQSLVKRPPSASLRRDAPPPAPGTRTASAAADTPAVPTERVKAFVRVRPFLPQEVADAAGGGRAALEPHFSHISDTGLALGGDAGEVFDVDGVMWSVAPEQAPVPVGITRGVASGATLYEAAAAPLASSVVGGRNACIIGVGYPHTGRSHTLWGNAGSLQRVVKLEEELEQADVVAEGRLTAELVAGERDHAFGLALRAATAIMDHLQAAAAAHATRQFEVTLSMAEVVADKCRDLLTREVKNGGYAGVALRTHPVLGPSLDAITRVPISNSSELQREVLRALRVHLATEAGAMAPLILTLDVQQTDIVANATDGSTMPVVRLSRFSTVDTGAWGRQASTNTTTPALRRVVDTLLGIQQSRRPAGLVPFRDSLVTSLLAGPLGGACRTVVVGTVSPHFVHADETAAVLGFLCRVRGVVNLVKQTGGATSNMMLDLKEEIAKLRQQLGGDGGDGSSGAASHASDDGDVRRAIQERESALSTLQVTANRAVERYAELRSELDATQTRSRELEEERAAAKVAEARVSVQLTEEKQRAFAQAFKGAFLAGRQAMELRAQEAEAAKHMRALREQLDHMKTQLVAIKGERDRFQFEAMKLDKELKRARVELHAANTSTSRLQKELNQAVDANEALETKLNLARFESTNEAHELRSKVLQLERERDEALFDADAKKKEIRGLRVELGRVAADTRGAAEVELKDMRVTLRAEQEQARALASEVLDLKDTRSRLEQHISELRTELDHARRDFEAKAEALDRFHSRDRDVLLRLKAAHSIERDAYLALLREGAELVADLRQAEALLLARPTMHRSGWPGVVAWLHSLGLDHLSSPFQQAGFTDMATVSFIQEADLAQMKVLSGTRRKILAAADRARRDMAAASSAARRGTARGPAAAPSPSPSPSPRGGHSGGGGDGAAEVHPQREHRSVRAMLDDLYDWMSDLRLTIEAEAEAAQSAARQREAASTSPRAAK